MNRTIAAMVAGALSALVYFTTFSWLNRHLG